MKYILTAILALGFLHIKAQKTQGAWDIKKEDTTTTIIIVDDYMVMAIYTDKAFVMTSGGRITSYDGGISGISEFHSMHKEKVGSAFSINANFLKDATKIDEANQFIAGNWRITQREQNGVLTPIHTTGPRKTIKILSSTRFQWAAINTETGEFSGTGGGMYSFKDGKYTEHIQFFSRDSTRIGMSLQFNAVVDGKDWKHSGKSSKGDPINEVWTRK